MLRRLCLYAYQNGHHAEDLSGCMGQRENGELKPSDVLEGSHKYVW